MPTRPLGGCTFRGYPPCPNRATFRGRCGMHRPAETRGTTAERGLGAEHRTLAAQIVREHRATHGDYCPGWGVPGHPSTDLAADHVIPRASGGTSTRSNLAVLCRRCNGRKRAEASSRGGG